MNSNFNLEIINYFISKIYDFLLCLGNFKYFKNKNKAGD